MEDTKEKTLKDKLDEAYDAAWTALMKSLTDNDVMFEDSDAACYVDDAGTKTTWALNVTLEKCPEYGGD